MPYLALLLLLEVRNKKSGERVYSSGIHISFECIHSYCTPYWFHVQLLDVKVYRYKAYQITDTMHMEIIFPFISLRIYNTENCFI